MKLRIRALDSKDTTRIEVPDNSSLQHLKQSISQAIGFPSPSFLRLSLNRSDDLTSSSPDSSLLSLGIAAGDLIFYSAVSAQDPTSPTQATTQTTTHLERERNDLDGENMEIDDESWRFPESCFVKRLVRVLGDDFGEYGFDRKLIVCAVHSVFLESGFVELVDNKLRFPSSMTLSISLRYTLPQIVEAEQDSDSKVESVVLKFQFMRNFITVYGSLAKPDAGSVSTYRVCIDERRFAPRIVAVCSNEEYDAEREVFELWRIAKDGLALPLMIDLCARAGLPGPPCFARLPSELQLKILELLPGADVAKTGCACRELNHLSRSNALWKQKVTEEFGAWAVESAGGSPAVHWESVFVECWWSKRRREENLAEEAERRMTRMRHRLYTGYAWLGPPNPFGGSGVGAVRWRGGGRRLGSRGWVRPICNLGGF